MHYSCSSFISHHQGSDCRRAPVASREAAEALMSPARTIFTAMRSTNALAPTVHYYCNTNTRENLETQNDIIYFCRRTYTCGNWKYLPRKALAITTQSTNTDISVWFRACVYNITIESVVTFTSFLVQSDEQRRYIGYPSHIIIIMCSSSGNEQ